MPGMPPTPHTPATPPPTHPNPTPTPPPIHTYTHIQMPVTRSLDIFLDLHLNKHLSKPSRRWWFETPLRSLWCHCNEVLCSMKQYLELGSQPGTYATWKIDLGERHQGQTGSRSLAKQLCQIVAIYWNKIVREPQIIFILSDQLLNDG